MEGKAKANCNLRRSYEEFKPSLNWNKEEGHDTLVIHLPGFKKDQINVQIDYLSNLKISGERPLEENRWSRFHKNFRIPNDCDADGIHAKFRGELLSITMPKKSTQQKNFEFRLGGFVLRWSKPLKVVLSVFVAIVVLVALGIYAANML